MANIPMMALAINTPTAGKGRGIVPVAADDYLAESPLKITLGTLTTDRKALDVSATWNDAAVTFSGIKLNVTDNASAAASLLLDLQVGSSPVFRVGKAKNIELFNAWTDADNNERGFMRFVNNILEIGAEKAGTGTARAVEFKTNNTTRMTISSDGARVGIGIGPGSAGRSLALLDGLQFGNGFGVMTTSSVGGHTSAIYSSARHTVIRSGSGSYQVILDTLPTSDPTVAGALWIDTGAGRVLKVSAG